MVVGLKQAVAASAFAFATGISVAAPGENGVIDLRSAAYSAKGASPSIGTSAAIITILEPMGGGAVQPLDARQFGADTRGTQSGKVTQGVGLLAVAATTPSFARKQADAADVESVVAAETDTGALILAGLGMAAFLALRRSVGG